MILGGFTRGATRPVVCDALAEDRAVRPLRGDLFLLRLCAIARDAGRDAACHRKDAAVDDGQGADAAITGDASTRAARRAR